MREIKFRAINSDNEFIYGLPYTDSINSTAYCDEYSNRMCWRNEKGTHCNQPYKNGTLMQYTGLKDKNGVEIYEGDVVTVDKLMYKVEYILGTYGISTPNGYKLLADVATSIDSGETASCEVIGNIYQTPDIETEKAVKEATNKTRKELLW